MKISEQWLREWVNPAVTTDELAHQLTMAGLEVEAIEPVAGNFTGVVVGEILSAEQHPDADKLRVCRVNAGGEEVQIVCGAPNARAGLRAPLAIVGAELPGDFKIKRAKLRGVESQGMLCAEAELGLSDANEGLMELAADAPVGTDLRDYLGLNDRVIELSLTPNRADCLSVAGIAREVGLLNNARVCAVESEPVAAAIEETFPVRLEAGDRCPRYVGRVIRGVDLSRPSPLWLQEKLRRCGIRSIDAAVDITNYLLLELGQPMHAFDLDRLTGGITVRLARAGESLELLNGQTIEPRTDSLLIADDAGPLALAGIMGGEQSAVSESTTSIFLESAFFAPDLLSGQARSYGLHTDSSHRFERGVDPQLQRRAIERATQLMIEILGGEAGPVIEAVSDDHLPATREIPLRRARIERLLGFALPDEEVERILSGLGLTVTSTGEGWQCQVPSWRFDLGIEVDLLEELARVHGYDRLPVTRIRADLQMEPRPERQLPARRLARHLNARGYYEAITYTFVDPRLQQLFDPELKPVALSNPISEDMSVMRTSQLPGLLSAVQRNVNRQRPRVRLFETGLRFLPTGNGLDQTRTLSLVATGRRQVESWNADRSQIDFYDIKGDLESLFALTGEPATFSFVAATRHGLHPGQSARIERAGQEIGFVGAVHPQVQSALDLEAPVFVAELDLQALEAAVLPTFEPLSRFPEVRRDIALIVDQAVPVAELMANVKSAAGAYLTELTLFDVYAGKGIDPERKSVALGLTFRDQKRTLGDEEVSATVSQVVETLKKNFNAELRG